MHKLSVTERDPKVSCSSLRKNGLVPMVYYHHGEKSVALQATKSDLNRALTSHKTVWTLSTGQNVVVKEVQKDPVSNKVVHVSLEGVVKGEKFHKTIPVRLTFDPNCQWNKEKLNMRQLVQEMEVETTMDALVEELVFDVSDLELNDVLRVSDLKVPVGMKFVEDEHMEIATVVHYREEKEEPEVETTVVTEPTPVTNEKAKNE